MRQLDKDIKTMSALTKENVNTKRDIKELASKLRSEMNQLMTAEVQRLMDKLGTNTLKTQFPQAHGSGENKTTQEECTCPKHGKAQHRGVEVGTQTTAKKEGEKYHKTEEMKMRLTEELQEAELWELLDKKWPEEVYVKCAKRTGNLEDIGEESSLIIYREEEKLEVPMLKWSSDRNPLLRDIIEGGQKETLICARMQSSILEADGQPSKECQCNNTFLICLPRSQSSSEDENLKTALNRAETKKKIQVKEVVCLITAKEKEIRLRKLIEYVFQKEDVEISVLQTGNQKNEFKKRALRRIRNAETIIVKPTEGTAYTDMLKQVKEKVDPRE